MFYFCAFAFTEQKRLVRIIEVKSLKMNRLFWRDGRRLLSINSEAHSTGHTRCHCLRPHTRRTAAARQSDRDLGHSERQSCDGRSLIACRPRHKATLTTIMWNQSPDVDSIPLWRPCVHSMCTGTTSILPVSHLTRLTPHNLIQSRLGFLREKRATVSEWGGGYCWHQLTDNWIQSNDEWRL